MTFGAGTRLTIKPSKYFILIGEPACSIFRDRTGLSGLGEIPCPFPLLAKRGGNQASESSGGTPVMNI